MIIGNGDIASALKESSLSASDKYLFFASGVSNSEEESESEYQRELDLLSLQDKTKHLVYFSSLSIFYKNTRYTKHKRIIESAIPSRFNSYTIIRLGNITWGNNPHTIINFIRNKIKANEPFDIKDEYRYIIEKDEFLHWINMIPEWACEMNITGTRLKVADIVYKYGYTYAHTK